MHQTLTESLYARVDDLIQIHKSSDLLSTSGTQSAIAELALRTQGLERALLELAAEVERLSAAHGHTLQR
jgi:hypothetical protein